MVYRIVWLILQPLKLFLGIKGKDNVKRIKNKGVIIVSNHVGVMDPLTIGMAMPFRRGEITWLSAIELFSFKSSFSLFTGDKKIGQIKAFFASFVSVILVNFSLTMPVNRSAKNTKTILTAVKTLKNKRMLGIFPEGGIGKKGEIHSAFVKLAIKTNSVILPVKICDDKIIFGEVIDISFADKREAEKIAEEIMFGLYSLK